eukprot:5282514-Prymnesium_polylepis.2
MCQPGCIPVCVYLGPGPTTLSVTPQSALRSQTQSSHACAPDVTATPASTVRALDSDLRLCSFGGSLARPVRSLPALTALTSFRFTTRLWRQREQSSGVRCD